jgi:hypothetical protein
MDTVTLAGLKPFDGSYEIDLAAQPITQREWGWVKRYADPQMVGVLAMMALHRNGKVETRDVPGLWERLEDAPFGATVTYEPGPVEDDADPPPPSSDARPSSNGADTSKSSETQEQPPSRTGPPPSATSGSDLVTSAT